MIAFSGDLMCDRRCGLAAGGKLAAKMEHKGGYFTFLLQVLVVRSHLFLVLAILLGDFSWEVAKCPSGRRGDPLSR